MVQPMNLRRKNSSSNPIYLADMGKINDQKSNLQKSLDWSNYMYPSSIGQTIIKSSKSRLAPIFISGLIILSGLIMGLRLFELQVKAYNRYNNLANGNRIRETVSFAPRGNIYDRKGQLIASNDIAFQLSVTPYLTSKDEGQRELIYSQIASILKLNQQSIKAKAESFGLEYPLPITVQNNIKYDQALNLSQFLPRLEGFNLSEVPIRSYVSDSGMAHIIGYIGAVSKDDLVNDEENNLLPIDIIGKSGIEKQYDNILRGYNGLDRTEVDTLGQPVRVLAKRLPKTGKDITLTIDLELQRRLAKELEFQMKKANVSKASAIAMDPNNGEVMAMVSIPYYDNNLFAQGITTVDFDRLVNDPNQPLINKVISAGYTTGSTIKPMVASAALEEKVITPETIIVDSGAIAVTSQYQPGVQFVFHGWRPGGLGPMNIRSAIAWSSNIYFYTVGGGHGSIDGLGVNRLTKYYRMFGLGEYSEIDLPNEINGLVPDIVWKKENKNEDWYVGDSYNISIGQGDLIVSPLQLTLGNMSIANGGYLMKPQLLLKIGDQNIESRNVKREITVSKNNLQIVREGMRQVITNGTTCECIFNKVPVKVAGKSGTAETNTPDGKRPHAWFTAYAPFDNPQIMITAMLEEGSGGSLYAAPAIAGAFETFFK